MLVCVANSNDNFLSRANESFLGGFYPCTNAIACCGLTNKVPKTINMLPGTKYVTGTALQSPCL